MSIRGSYHDGFAPRDAEPRYPQLWRGVIGCWAPCLGPSGTVLRDIGGRGYHANFTNMSAESDWVVSYGRYALDFDGTDDYVLVPTGAMPTGSAARSISCWIKTTSTAKKAFIGGGANAAQQRFELAVAAANQIGFYIDGGNRIFTATNVNDGSWHHIVYQNTAGSTVGAVSVYMDGVALAQVSSAGSTNVLNTGAGTIQIGSCTVGTPTNFLGQMDEIVLYDRVISDSQIGLLKQRRGIMTEMRSRRRHSNQDGGAAAIRRHLMLLGVGR